MKKYLLFLFTCTVSFQASAQCPPGTTPGPELVVNGDFQSGNTGFTTGYNYQPPPNTTEGQYWVATGAQVSSWNGGMQSTGDHTTGTGNFLLVNGSPVKGTNIWCETIMVTPNTQYILSGWIASLDIALRGVVQFYIDGVAVGPGFIAPDSVDVWNPFSTAWNSGALTSIDLCLIDTNFIRYGNDFGLDDISLKSCGCGFTATASGDTSLCPGNNVQLNSSMANDYTWSPSSGLSCTTCQSPIASPNVTTTYTLIAANSNACTDTDTVVVQIYPPVQASAGNNVSVCNGGIALLMASGGVSYAWQPATGLSNTALSNPSASPSFTTTYTVTVTDANNCSASSDVTVNVYPPVHSSAGPDTALCSGSPAQLFATGGTQYSWEPDDGLNSSNIANPVVKPVESNTYTVTITDADNCTAQQTLTIEVFPDFSTTISADTSVCLKQPATLTATGGSNYNWSPPGSLSCDSCSTVTALPEINTFYTVVITDNNDCKKGKNVTVTVLNNCDDIYMPNAFSPNSDGRNDFLSPISSKISKINWSVYNRWGQMVFAGNNINSAWNGTFNGQNAAVGVYVWYIQATMDDGTNVVLKGNVTLLR